MPRRVNEAEVSQLLKKKKILEEPPSLDVSFCDDEALPPGIIFTDVSQKKWRLGKPIGKLYYYLFKDTQPLAITYRLQCQCFPFFHLSNWYMDLLHQAFYKSISCVFYNVVTNFRVKCSSCQQIKQSNNLVNCTVMIEQHTYLKLDIVNIYMFCSISECSKCLECITNKSQLNLNKPSILIY